MANRHWQTIDDNQSGQTWL